MSNTRTTWFCVETGRAIVLGKNNETQILEADSSNRTILGPRVPEEKMDLSAWIKPMSCQIIEFDIGEFPFEGLQTYMLLRTGVRVLMDLFNFTTNPEHPQTFRERNARFFERHYAEATPDVITEFRRIMLETPMSMDMDYLNAPFQINSQGASLLCDMVARRRPTHS